MPKKEKADIATKDDDDDDAGIGTSQLLSLKQNDDSPPGNSDRSSVVGCVGRYVPPTIVRHYTVRTSARALLLACPSKWHTHQGSVVHGLITSALQVPPGTGHPRGQVHALRLTGQSVHPMRGRSVSAVSVRFVRQNLRCRRGLTAPREATGRLGEWKRKRWWF